MDMMLNSLPSRTWNRLGINESFININNTLEPYAPHLAQDSQDVTWQERAETVQAWYEIETGAGNDLNNLLAQTPLSVIESQKGAVMHAPLVLHYDYQDDDCKAHRLYIHAAEQSQLSIVMLLRSQDTLDGGISAIQTKIKADKNAQVQICIVQLLGDHMVCLNDVSGVCDENASVELTKLELGSAKLYAGTRFDLMEANGHFGADVGYLARENQTLDMNYIANHFGKKTTSLMEVSGTLEEGSRKVFRGSIDFKRGSKGAVGTENENVLLLGDKIINQTIPLILCQEEDVEGNHGASIGRLDEKVLFYLSTRGIAEEEAQRIVERARIDSICAKIPDETSREAVRAFQKKECL